MREIVDTPEKMKIWALDEFGLMFEGVFYPERFLRDTQLSLYHEVWPNHGL